MDSEQSSVRELVEGIPLNRAPGLVMIANTTKGPALENPQSLMLVSHYLPRFRKFAEGIWLT
jgi:hypothetical protein